MSAILIGSAYAYLKIEDVKGDNGERSLRFGIGDDTGSLAFIDLLPADVQVVKEKVDGWMKQKQETAGSKHVENELEAVKFQVSEMEDHLEQTTTMACLRDAIEHQFPGTKWCLSVSS